MVGNTFVIQTTERRCTIAGREHRSNHQYLVLDPNGSIERRCHNSQCNQKPATQKETLPRELVSLLFTGDGVSHDEAINEHEENVVECLGDLSNLTREHLCTDKPEGNVIVSKILKDWNGLSKHQHCGSSFVAVSSPAGLQIRCEGCGKSVPPVPIPIDPKYSHLVQFFNVNIVNNFYHGAELEPQGKSWVGPKAKIVLEYAHQHGFLRAGGCIYKRVNKWAIVQFERKGEPCDYKGFVNMVFEEDQMRLWEQAGVVTTLAKNMEDTDSKYFPLVHRNPQYVAFNNGVWDLKSLKFHPLASPGPGDIIAGHYLNFDFSEDWKNLDTPLFDELIAFQLPDQEVAYWFSVLIGRLQYTVKQHDDWQVMPFLQGAGGTGKSTVLAVVQAMFANDQLGNVGSRHEASFGLMGLYTKRVVIAPDIPANISSRLPDGDFKTMVTGDPMSVAIKYKDPINIPNWEPPMIWAGNTYPDYQDVGGAISRRFAKFEFNNIVTKTNGTLVSQILDSELGNLYVKCVSRYRHEATNHQRGRFVDFAPQYFRYANLEVTEVITKPDGSLIDLLDFLLMQLTSDQQQLFVRSSWMYLHRKGECCIDLEVMMKWMGLKKKDKLKAKLVCNSNYEQGRDYTVALQTGENPRLGGRPSERILLTPRTFKKLCAASDTAKGDEIREYFVLMEEHLLEYLGMKGVYELRLQQEANTKLVQAAEAKAAEEQRLREKEQRRWEKLESKMKGIEFEALVPRETLYVMQERAEADKRVHKVGFTKNANGSGKRAKSFETSHASGVDIHYERKVFNAPLVERDVHSILHRYRQQRDEFFMCDLHHTKNVIDYAAAVSNTLHGCHEPISREDMGDKLIEAIEREKAKKRVSNQPTTTTPIKPIQDPELTDWLSESVTYCPGRVEWVSTIRKAFEEHRGTQPRWTLQALIDN
ncbi:hypothetical protein HK102_002602 [Quaeritorhiza haematococci]|nr:hypothetical protein HK102_002602 [Quaeritorhiza haematococci]